MRVNASSRPDALVPLRDLDRGIRVVGRGADRNHAQHARCCGGGNDLIHVVAEAFVGQMTVRIEELQNGLLPIQWTKRPRWSNRRGLCPKYVRPLESHALARRLCTGLLAPSLLDLIENGRCDENR